MRSPGDYISAGPGTDNNEGFAERRRDGSREEWKCREEDWMLRGKVLHQVPQVPWRHPHLQPPSFANFCKRVFTSRAACRS